MKVVGFIPGHKGINRGIRIPSQGSKESGGNLGVSCFHIILFPPIL